VRKVYVVSDNIITSLGFTAENNLAALEAGQTGIRLHEDEQMSPSPFWASLVDLNSLNDRFSAYADPDQYTRFEKLIICSIQDAIKNTSVSLTGEKTLFILSTTKGNIDLLDPKHGARFEESRLYLWNTAQLLQRFFRLHHRPWVVSNACISGVLAVIIGKRLIGSGEFDHVVVTGADLVNEFVLSGFNSFLSLCPGPCKPFDADRQGLSLGEGSGTIILSADRNLSEDHGKIIVGPGFSNNDANHISGPSRTGEGLYMTIRRTMENTGRKINFISAHGTATPFNDEMESIAITRAGLQNIPVNSFKGYWGHTLGAAGIIESVAGIGSIRHNRLFRTLGFSRSGVTHPIAVIDETKEYQTDTILKIASGFGGCNASLLFYRS